MLRSVLLASLFFFSFKANANFDFNSNCRKAYEHIFHLEFEAAKKNIEEEKRIRPANFIPYYLDNYIEFLSSFISEEVPIFSSFKENQDTRLKRLKKESLNSPFYRYFQAEMLLQRGLTRFKFKEYVTAAYEINKAYHLLKENSQLFPEFKANQKSLGFLHVVAGSIPHEYKWILNILGISGSIDQGLNEVMIANSTAKGSDYEYIYPETIFILTYINLSILKNDQQAEKIVNEFILLENSNSALLKFLQVTVALKQGKNEQAIDILSEYKFEKDKFPVAYLYYVSGLCRLNKLDKSANKFFLAFVKIYKGKSFIKSAYQKLAWYELINGNTEMYNSYMNQCNLLGGDFIDEDKQALNEFKNSEVPDVTLLKARLLFDGGYYYESLDQIKNKKAEDFLLLKNKLELTYRLARIYHKMKDYEKAIGYYEQIISAAEKLKYYFAANSALELGNLYEQLGNKNKAKQYFKKCLAMRNHEYQNGIDQKAKAGLNRLGFYD